MNQPEGGGRDRGHWKAKAGFVLAAAGSAIGLGNLWKFPYVTHKHGGGAFVLVYLGCLLLVGLPVLLAELVVGRRSQSNPVGAFRRLKKRPNTVWSAVGVVAVLTSFVLLSYYSVVAGWTIEYTRKAFAGEFEPETARVREFAGSQLLVDLERAGDYDPSRPLATRTEDAARAARGARRLLEWRIGILASRERAPVASLPGDELDARIERLEAAQKAYREAVSGSGFLPDAAERKKIETAREAFEVEARAVDETLRPVWIEVAADWQVAPPGAEEWEALEAAKREDLLAEYEAGLPEGADPDAELQALARRHVNMAGFREFTGDTGRVVTNHLVFMGLTILVVLLGVAGGIERVSKVLMPALLVLLVALFVRALLLDGRSEGLAAMFRFDFAHLHPDAVLEALGHAFFTLSLGMGAMITYGSYLRGEDNLNVSAVLVGTADTAVALLATMTIFICIASFGLDPGSDSIGVLFHTLPVIFTEIPGGTWWGASFFLLVGFAALTSMISLLEVVVSYVVDEWRWPRPVAAIVAGGAITSLGLLSARSLAGPFPVDLPGLEGSIDFLGFFDYLCANWLLPLGGLFTCLFLGWGIHSWEKQEEVRYGAVSGTLYFVWDHVLLKFVAPMAIVLVILHKLGLTEGMFGWLAGVVG